jgi:hypothetical protein
MNRRVAPIRLQGAQGVDDLPVPPVLEGRNSESSPSDA